MLRFFGMSSSSSPSSSGFSEDDTSSCSSVFSELSEVPEVPDVSDLKVSHVCRNACIQPFSHLPIVSFCSEENCTHPCPLTVPSGDRELQRLYSQLFPKSFWGLYKKYSPLNEEISESIIQIKESEEELLTLQNRAQFSKELFIREEFNQYIQHHGMVVVWNISDSVKSGITSVAVSLKVSLSPSAPYRFRVKPIAYQGQIGRDFQIEKMKNTLMERFLAKVNVLGICEFGMPDLGMEIMKTQEKIWNLELKVMKKFFENFEEKHHCVIVEKHSNVKGFSRELQVGGGKVSSTNVLNYEKARLILICTYVGKNKSLLHA